MDKYEKNIILVLYTVFLYLLIFAFLFSVFNLIVVYG